MLLDVSHHILLVFIFQLLEFVLVLFTHLTQTCLILHRRIIFFIPSLGKHVEIGQYSSVVSYQSPSLWPCWDFPREDKSILSSRHATSRLRYGKKLCICILIRLGAPSIWFRKNQLRSNQAIPGLRYSLMIQIESLTNKLTSAFQTSCWFPPDLQ